MSAMSDFESQLRQAMSAAVADAQPPQAVMELVRRRNRRRNARLAVAGAVAIAVAVAVAPVVNALRSGGGRPAHGRTSGAPLFPGGGRILLRANGDLKWLYPDGRTVQIASGFAGARPDGSELLAWKHASPPGSSRFLPHGCFDPDCTRIHDLSYYTMNLDGSDSRLILPAAPPVGNRAMQYEDAQLSPDGSRLAYISQELRNGTKNIFLGASELWSVDLATGRKIDLGPYVSYIPFAWRDDATIIVDSPNGRSIQLVNVQDGSRTDYLTVDDPRLIGAYERARPGAGPPVSIGLDGWSPGPGPSALAVSLDGRARIGRNTNKPAEILVEKSRVLAFAPSSSPWISLTLKWGSNGVFLLDSQSGKCDCPDLWNNVTYAGTVHNEQLSRVQTISGTWDTSAVSPEGTVIALANVGVIDFSPVPSPACDLAGKCLHFQMKQVLGRGALLAWEP
jgi:hypothetical protein